MFSSERFLDLVEKLCGSPLSSDAWVHELNQDTEQLIKEEKEEYEKAVASGAPTGDVDLQMKLRVVDGDAVLASSADDGGFEGACNKFAKIVAQRVAAKN